MTKKGVKNHGTDEASQENLPDTGAAEGANGVSLHKGSIEDYPVSAEAASQGLDPTYIWRLSQNGWVPVSPAPDVAKNATTDTQPTDDIVDIVNLMTTVSNTPSSFNLISGYWGEPVKRGHTPRLEPREQVVTGWRGYTYRYDGKLEGSVKDWDSARMKAECLDTFRCMRTNRQTENQRHEECANHLKTNRCSCGIWGVAKPEKTDATERHPILAACHAWGVVLMDGGGNWRATDVEIQALFLVKSRFRSMAYNKFLNYEAMADELGARYRVPVRILRDMKELSNA